MGEVAAHRAKRPHTREVLLDVLSLLLMGGEKNLEGVSEAAVHGAQSRSEERRVGKECVP